MPRRHTRSAGLACLVIATAVSAPAALTPTSPGQPAQTAASAKRPLMRFTFTDGSALTGRLLSSGPGGYVVQGPLGTTTLPADQIAAARPVPDVPAMLRQERRAAYARAVLVPLAAPLGPGTRPARRRGHR